ncbi:carbohydrate kinase family protein [Amycolatopsis thermoflava]|uniref:carbohydrate kinase family protein n=1 Tax=Amycolatopsis thermoflava TaxID=84480 RepID=UPI00041E0FE6|nr:carbohydrate kinase family protein [Amycolatopsis thermoflava]
MSGRRIVVSGSIATDHLMVFPGKFSEQLVTGELDKISLSFLVDDLEVRRGGTGANIAFGMGSMGLSPVLVGAVGRDFGSYRSWLEQHRVDTRSVLVSDRKHTARFVCTTDAMQNQIASFYGGAMAEAHEIGLDAVVERVGEPRLVVIAPNDPAAMMRHTEECRQWGFPFAADPSQQLARMDGREIRALVTGAVCLFTNEYETSLLLRATGWSTDTVLNKVGCWVMTHGADGVHIRSTAGSTIVRAVPTDRPADPTGVGDAFRAGFLWGVHVRLGLERSAQVGCTLATIALESIGTQEYRLDRADFSERIARVYGGEAAGEIESRLRV